MNYLLTMRLLLSATVLFSFSIRYIAVLRHKPGSAEGRLGFIILTSVLLYGGVLLASINKMTYLNVFATAAALLAVCFVLEVGLQKLAKRVERESIRATVFNYFS